MATTSSWKMIVEKGIPVYNERAPALTVSLDINNVDSRTRGTGGLDDDEDGAGDEDDDPDILEAMIAVLLVHVGQLIMSMGNVSLTLKMPPQKHECMVKHLRTGVSK